MLAFQSWVERELETVAAVGDELLHHRQGLAIAGEVAANAGDVRAVGNFAQKLDVGIQSSFELAEDLQDPLLVHDKGGIRLISSKWVSGLSRHVPENFTEIGEVLQVRLGSVIGVEDVLVVGDEDLICLLYTSPSPRD